MFIHIVMHKYILAKLADVVSLDHRHIITIYAYGLDSAIKIMNLISA